VTIADAGIRLASEADAQAVAGIIARVITEPNPVGFMSALSADQVTAWVRRLGDQGALFLATVEDGAAGFGALDFNTEDPETGTLGVWVLPEYRRKGLATQLGEALLDFARDKGYRRIRGRLPDENPAALSFLSSLGALVPLQNPEMRFDLPL